MFVDHVNSGGMKLTAFECRERATVAHETGNEILPVVSSKMLGGEKHCRVTAAEHDLASHHFAILEESHLYASAFSVSFDDQTVGARGQAGQFSQAVDRTDHHPPADLGHLGSDVVVGPWQWAQQFPIDDLAAALDAEEIFDPA